VNTFFHFLEPQRAANMVCLAQLNLFWHLGGDSRKRDIEDNA